MSIRTGVMAETERSSAVMRILRFNQILLFGIALIPMSMAFALFLTAGHLTVLRMQTGLRFAGDWGAYPRRRVLSGT